MYKKISKFCFFILVRGISEEYGMRVENIRSRGKVVRDSFFRR